MKKYALLYFEQINDNFSKWMFPLHDGENIIGSDKDVDIFLYLNEKEDIIDSVHCKIIVNEVQNDVGIINLTSKGYVKRGENDEKITLSPGKEYELNHKSVFYLTDNVRFMLIKGTIDEIHEFFSEENLENEFQKWKQNENKTNEINIGFQLDPGYILRVMMTLASIMDSQNKNTIIRFHFAVVLSFKVEEMLKIYILREKIREDVEFNFYNAKRVEIDLKNINSKGPGAFAKLLLPQLLPNDIEKLIVFDTGDLLVLRDLKEMYNWNMKKYLYLGVPGLCVGKYAKITKKKFNVYINTGSFLINVKMIKYYNIYKKFIKYKNIYKHSYGDQDLLNDIGFGKIGYLPIKFGIRSPYINDNDSDAGKNSNFKYINKIKLKYLFNFLPKNENELFRLGYNPVVIHQLNGKWMDGKGLTIYRRLAQYYIKLAGIWDEMCEKHPGYCKK